MQIKRYKDKGLRPSLKNWTRRWEPVELRRPSRIKIPSSASLKTRRWWEAAFRVVDLMSHNRTKLRKLLTGLFEITPHSVNFIARQKDFHFALLFFFFSPSSSPSALTLNHKTEPLSRPIPIFPAAISCLNPTCLLISSQLHWPWRMEVKCQHRTAPSGVSGAPGSIQTLRDDASSVCERSLVNGTAAAGGSGRTPHNW